MKIQGMTLDGYRFVLQDGGKDLTRKCPKCGKRKSIREFGLRHMTNTKVIRLQAQCTECRDGDE